MNKMCYNVIKVGGRMKKVLVLVGVILVLALGIGMSYAMWIMTNKQDNMNVIETTNKCFSVELTSESDNIKLENTYPISDDAGSKLSPYSFKITNTCDWNAYYKVNLETLNKSTIDNKFIKASINNSNPQVINRYKETETSLKDGKAANILKSGYLPVGGSVSFDLRLWMDYETTIDDIKNDGTDKWIGKIVVVSNLVEDEEILAACKSHGGDLIDNSECRKYYVNLNQQFNINDVVNGSWTFKIINSNSFSLSGGDSSRRFGPVKLYEINHLYFVSFNASSGGSFSSARNSGENDYPLRATMYSWKNSDNYYYYSFLENYNSFIIIPDVSDWSAWYYEWGDNEFTNYSTIDLTLMFGAGNEPEKEWCDKYLTNYLEYNSEGTKMPIKDIGEPIKTAYYDVISLID